MEHRPLRMYVHVFTAEGVTDPIRIARSGVTPCRAKNAAFVALEAQIATDGTLPKRGWRLLEQVDVTHLVTRGGA